MVDQNFQKILMKAELFKNNRYKHDVEDLLDSIQEIKSNKLKAEGLWQSLEEYQAYLFKKGYGLVAFLEINESSAKNKDDINAYISAKNELFKIEISPGIVTSITGWLEKLLNGLENKVSNIADKDFEIEEQLLYFMGLNDLMHYLYFSKYNPAFSDFDIYKSRIMAYFEQLAVAIKSAHKGRFEWQKDQRNNGQIINLQYFWWYAHEIQQGTHKHPLPGDPDYKLGELDN